MIEKRIFSFSNKGPLEDPGATDMRPQFCPWCCSCYPHRALLYITSCFTEATELFGLEVSLKKRELLYQSVPWEEYWLSHINIDVTELKAIYWFTYLKTGWQRWALYLANYTNSIWCNRHLKAGTNNSVYRAIVLATHLYALGYCGSLITTYDSLSSSTSTASAPSSISISIEVLEQPTSRLYF